MAIEYVTDSTINQPTKLPTHEPTDLLTNLFRIF